MRRTLRSLLPTRVYQWLSKLLDAGLCLSKLGPKGFHLLRMLARSNLQTARLEKVDIPTVIHPIYIRPGSSDVVELVCSTIRQPYGHYLPSPPVRVIIDAGANIGDTTVWYLSKFPEALVIAVEPDPENFRLLEINCRPYGNRALLLCSALWAETARLSLQHSRSCNEISVRAYKGDNECQGISIPDLIRRYGISQIDILKMNIEGAENAIFSAPEDGWIGHVRTMVIAVHGPEGLAAVQAVTRRNNFSHRVYRNLHFFYR